VPDRHAGDSRPQGRVAGSEAHALARGRDRPRRGLRRGGEADPRGAGARGRHRRVRSFARIESLTGKDRVMKVLVTGITGFAGSHLVDYILAEKPGVQVVGIQRWRSRTENVEHFLDKVRMVECDLRDASSVRDVLDEERPDWIFHLAAQSFVPTS